MYKEISPALYINILASLYQVYETMNMRYNHAIDAKVIFLQLL